MAVNDLIIFGVDAADFDVLDSPDVDLPTFDRLMDTGVAADLESTLPPITGAAWPSMACGRGPNSTGMFDFVNFSREQHQEYRPSPDKVDPFWSYLFEVGYRVGISGFPLAPLDTPVDGFVLSWPWYLPEDEQRLSPPDFFDNTDIVVDDYIRPNTEFDFDRVMRDLEDKIEFDERVLAEFDFDVYYTYLDADTTIHMTKTDDKERLHEVYRTIDEGMDRMLSHCDDDCAAMVVSDHGFSEVWGHFHIDQFLHDNGHLSLDRSGGQATVQRTGLPRLVQPMKEFAKKSGIADIVRPYLDDQETRQTLGLRFDLELDDVDWEDTFVVNSGNWGQLYDLTADRDSIDEVIEQIDRLASAQGFDVEVRDPAEEYGTTDLHPDCPDAVVTIRKDGQTVLHSSSMTSVETDDEEYFEQIDPHLDQGEIGVFIASGPEFAVGETVDGFHLTDLAPTILTYFEGTIPPELDGTAQSHIYDSESHLSGLSPEIGFLYLYEQMIDDGASRQRDVEEVKEKLSHLGYFE